MKKFKVRMISAVLAFCMLLSGTVSVFAAEPTYTAKYDWKATKEVYSTIIADADQLLSDAAFNGNTVQEIWKLMPQINDLLFGLGVDIGAGKAEFYVTANENLFSDFSAYVEENSVETVDADVLAAYFTEYPANIESPDAFKTAVKSFVDSLLIPEIGALLFLVISMTSGGEWSVEESFRYFESFFGSVDDICSLLGVKQEMTFYDAFDMEGIYSGEQTGTNLENMKNYIYNIIDTLIPDTVDKAVGILQSLMIPENNAKLYSAIKNILTKLNEMIGNLGTNLGALGVQIDLSAVQETVSKISGYIGKVPLNDDGSIEWNGAVEYIVNDVVLPELAGMDLDIIGFGDTTSAIVKLDELNPANLASAADTTDALNVILHYLYNNLNKNKSALDFVLPLLPDLGVTLPQEITDMLSFIITNSESDSVWEIYSMLEVASGNEAPVLPQDPNQPGDPDPVDPSDPADPSDPVDPSDPMDPSQPSDDGKLSDTQKPSDTKAPQTAGKNTANPSLPNTGAQEMTALFVMIPATAAALFLIVAALRKKALEK